MTAIVGGVAQQSILLVPMSPALGVIDRYRRRLDPSARYEMPAHVTVLWPFAPPASLTEAVLERLEALFAQVDAFDYRLARTGWFERRVLYLAPTPVEAFRDLTTRVAAAFPEYPPYEGAFDDIVPHVTVAAEKPPALMAATGWLARRSLPVEGRVTEIWLMTIGDVAPLYRLRRSFPLRQR